MDAHLSEHLDEPEGEERAEQLPVESPLRQGADFDRESGLSHATKYSPEETLSRCESHLRAFGYSVRMQDSTLQALREERGGQYQWSFISLVVVLVIFIVNIVVFIVNPLPPIDVLFWTLILPAAYVYRWFTRETDRIVVSVAGGQFAIQYDGSKATLVAEQLSDMLRE
jgi:hypothetical protein